MSPTKSLKLEVAEFGVPLPTGFLASAAQTHQREGHGADGGRPPVPQMKQENVEELAEMVRLVPQAGMRRACEHSVDAPDDAGEADQMDVLSEVQDPSGIGPD